MSLNKNFISGLILGAFIASIFWLILLQNKSRNTKIQYERLQNLRQAALIDSMRREDLSSVMSNLFTRIEDELKLAANRTLGDERVDAIAALCYSFGPRTYYFNDSLASRKLSPERGQMLLLLSGMNIDSVTFQKIKIKASFEGAMLRNADLRKVNLSDINLKGSDLQDANLEGATLNGANLNRANLWGANLNHTLMSGAELTNADIRWAELNGAVLIEAHLNGAEMGSSHLRKADLRGAELEWTGLNGAFLQEADLSGANLFRTNFRKAQLSNSKLSDANLTLANLIESNLRGADMNRANLTGAEMSDAIVADKNWLDLLDEWQVKGAKEIQEKYRLEDESSPGEPQFRLVKLTPDKKK